MSRGVRPGLDLRPHGTPAEPGRSPKSPASREPESGPRPTVLVLMGVTGAGKTSVGTALARELGWSFHDADAFHPEENIARMRAGIALLDEDRESWLAALEALVADLLARGESAVLACSALRRRYRDRLARPAATGAGEVRFVLLRVTPEAARERLARRPGHFMPATLIDSQFDALEVPRDALIVDAARTVAELVAEIRRTLAR